MRLPRPPPLAAMIVTMLAATALMLSLSYLFEHGFAILAGCVVLMAILSKIKDLTQ
ncbi:MAG: hypothetical protein J5833_03095 [Victivallales bacterium]|nr:hypothetical protein [Victivallales bacterium]